MPTKPKGTSYPVRLPCGCRAAYSYKRGGKRKLQRARDVILIEGYKDGRRMCKHGRIWRLVQEWEEIILREDPRKSKKRYARAKAKGGLK